MTAKIKIEKDIFASSGIANTAGGNGEIIDLWDQGNGTKRYSLHFDWTVNTFTNKTFGTAEVNTTDDTITITAHGYETGLAFTLTTSGTLPSPLLVATTYYIISIDANTIKVASSLVNAQAGTAIDITTTGSGTQTVNVTALVGGTVDLMISNSVTSENAVWTSSVSQSVTSTGGAITAVSNSIARFVRVTKAITSGSFSFRAYLLAIEDKYFMR